MESGLKIVTYNIHNGYKADVIIKNLAALKEQKVSVFCLQELRQYQGQEFLLGRLLKTLGSSWQAEYLILPESHDLGLCILWKGSDLQAMGFETVLLPKLKQPRLYEKAFQRVVHKFEKSRIKFLAPPQRGAFVGNFNLHGKNLRITNVHLDWQGGFKHRSLQLRHLYSRLRALPLASHEIFCGDFNTLGFYRFSGRRLKKVKSLLGGDFKNAFANQRTTSYLQMLDHIFVKNLTVVKAKVFKYKGSDHYPLVADVKI